MKQSKNLLKFNSSPIFTRKTLSLYLGIKYKSLTEDISRWLKQEKLIELKKGTYITSEFFIRNKDNQSYLEFLANKLKEPSYISTEYVLQKFSILTESVFSFTSITLQKTNSYSNKLGNFIYNNIKPDLFIGFDIKNRNGFQIAEAKKMKALFDFLYLRTYKKQESEISKDFVNTFRLNLLEITNEDINEFKFYLKIAGQKKLFKLVDILNTLKNEDN